MSRLLRHRLNISAQLLKLVGLGLFALAGAGGLVYLITAEQVRIAVAAVVVTVLTALAMVRLQLGILATFVFLVLLGDLRRLLLLAAQWSGTDPLLVVGPAFAILTTGYALASGQLSFEAPVSKWMLMLMGIMVLQVFNPRQGGIFVGIVGLMFQIMPILWFWIGQAYGDRAFLHTLLFRVVLGLSTVAMLFGLYQSLVGYLPYQLEWYHTAGYVSLGTPETGLAPITFFASGQEHNIFVNLGMILLWTLVLFNVRTALLPIPIFFGALLITGTRGPIAKGLVMMTGLWAIMGRTLTTWVLRGLFALAIAAGGLFWTLSTATQNLEGTPERVEHKIERQSEEFVEGSGRGGGQSSASNHLSMLVWGYQTALQSPLGHGIAAGTKAEKLGSPAGSTETDLGDSFMALGIPGGIVYHIIVILLIVNAFQLWIKDNGPIPMAILGFMGITFLGWLGGGAYAVQPLLWFCLGAIVKARSST